MPKEKDIKHEKKEHSLIGKVTWGLLEDFELKIHIFKG
jgi:hypothetical protein